MTEKPSAPSAERPGPADISDAAVIAEVRRAAVWIGMALLVAGVIVLSQPILLIIGGMVFAVILDGGTRLLGRVLPIARGWRLAIVTLAGFAFVGWVFYFAGTTLIGQASELREVVRLQWDRLIGYAVDLDLMPSEGAGLHSFSQQILGGVGRLTSAVSTAIGAVTVDADDHRHRHLRRDRAAAIRSGVRLDAAGR